MITFAYGYESGVIIVTDGYDKEDIEVQEKFQNVPIKDFFDFLRHKYIEKLNKHGYQLDDNDEVTEISEYRGI